MHVEACPITPWSEKKWEKKKLKSFKDKIIWFSERIELTIDSTLPELTNDHTSWVVVIKTTNQEKVSKGKLKETSGKR